MADPLYDQYCKSFKKHTVYLTSSEYDPLVVKLAKKLETTWFEPLWPECTLQGNVYWSHSLDNYPGQHLSYQAAAYERAREIIAMIRNEDGST